MKKIIQTTLVLLSVLLAGYSANLRAEDIDIYVDNASTAGVPNVLFVMDNGANFSANAKIGCSTYNGTTEAPSLGTSTGAGILQCALVDAINSLPDGAMNIGVLVSNANGLANDTRSPSDPAYHERCATDTGGCLLRKLTLMTSSNKASLVKFIKSWQSSGQTNATSFNVKVNSALPGAMMQEAWAYYNGKIGMSGTDYGTSVIQTGCQRNFVIYIANTEKSPDNETDSYSGSYGLASAQVGASDAQKAKIKEKVKFNPATCGVSEYNYGSNQSDWSENWADEWARLMQEQDRGLPVQDGTQNITTYTIGITNDATCTPDYPSLLSTMAKYGGGKYFKTGNASELVAALGAILNEVQAVNSVFSSASLPVSVNAEGSYLNQIFLGMFRPDSGGNPRWLGNLKQFQLVRNSAGSLVLGDARGTPAISSAGTGFITPTAVSFWTYRDDANDPDKLVLDPDTNTMLGGFFRKSPLGTPKSGFDSPDGEVVEKGGVAQQVRKENLKADFSATAGSSSNPRRLYTYCPTGSSCVANLTDSSNAFSPENSGIPATAFGTTTAVRINSIVRNGTSALVTTSGNHGFSAGSTFTISNASPSDYNVTQTLTSATVNSSTTFTITGLKDLPTPSTAGTYKIALVGGTPVVVSSIVRGTSTTGWKNSEPVTVTTASAHGFTTASNLVVSGASPTSLNVSGSPTAYTANTLTFSVPIYPPATASSGYSAAISSTTYPTVGVQVSKLDSATMKGSTTAAHGFWVGMRIQISGASNNANKYNGTYTVASIPDSTSFTAVAAMGNGNVSNATAFVQPDPTAQAVGSLRREATTASAVATVTGMPAKFFGVNAGDKRVVTITRSAGTPTNEGAYLVSDVTATCLDAGCTSFTYPITVSPSDRATGSMTVGVPGASSVSVAAGAITRVGNTATAVVTANTFSNGQQITITPTGTTFDDEAAYVGTWTVQNCNASCSSFTFGPVTQTPSTPATGSNMQAYSGTTAPDSASVIRWVRGANNQGDETAPMASITVRPSIHGDVLHSRPIVINYGDSRGIVVFYGTNDGIFRAVNGNEAAAIGSVPAGGELWGLVLPEHFPSLNRLRLNAPELRFPSTFLSSAQYKDYFVDGPTGSYQRLKADGTIDKAYLFLTMRRGGRFMYALDVSTPSAPKVLWKLSNLDSGFDELGQTWSRPRLTLLQNLATTDANGVSTKTPVLVFGGGYDPSEDSEPPAADSVGRGVFVINAETGALIWSANARCATSSTCLNVPSMKYAVPSEVAFVDRDNNGYIDKFYFGDLGGNVWRADVSDGSTSNWKVTRVAALGCSSGACSAGTTPRKFFYPPSVLSVRAAGAADSYELISVASGDREHPLKNTATGSAYNTADKFFVIKDLGTTVGAPVAAPSTTNVNLTNLSNATSTPWDGSGSGFYVNFATGEKAVNAPLAVNGDIFFATNKPIDRTNTCVANLGEARAYAVSPFNGTTASNVLQGGGLPPSAVSGLITIDTANADGSTSSTLEKFCIGCGISGSDVPGGNNTAPCNSALENCNVGKTINKNLRRTYWYKK